MFGLGWIMCADIMDELDSIRFRIRECVNDLRKLISEVLICLFANMISVNIVK